MNVIIGIDPGTTTAYAALDLLGKIVKMESRREMPFSELLKETSEFDVIGAATDKKSIPELIKKFAAARGARIFSPKEDLTIDEKREILQGCSCENSHERDSAAAALYAIREIGPLVSKIRRFIAEEGPFLDEEAVARVEQNVIVSGENIKSAIFREIKCKESKFISAHEKKISAGTVPDEKKHEDNGRMAEDLRRLREENRLLLNQNINLKKRILWLSQRIGEQSRGKARENELMESKIMKRLSQKEQRMIVFSKMLAEKDDEIRKLKEEKEKISKALFSLSEKQLVKKLENLGWEEKKIRALRIIPGETIFVRNPNIFSEKTVEFLKDKIYAVISPEKPGQEIAKKFFFIDASKIRLEDFGSFMLACPDEIRREKEKGQVFQRIVEEYRKEREK